MSPPVGVGVDALSPAISSALELTQIACSEKSARITG
jgi:hypothetical protein